MSYYKKKRWVGKPNGFERYDPRSGKYIHIDPYERNQRYKKYQKATTIIKRDGSITNRQFLLGDFDKDKIKNIDDKLPLKKSNETVEELQLSNALISLDKIHNESEKNRKLILKKFRKSIKQTNPKISSEELEKKTPSRAKTPISLLHKSLNLQIPKTTDKIGMMYIGKNYDDLNKIKNSLKKNFKVVELRDYYNKPKLGYKAIHLILKENSTGEIFEVQLKTKRIKRIADINHTLYKKNIQNTKEFKRLVNLSEKADNGNKNIQNYMDNLSNNQIKKFLTKKEV